MHTQLRSIAATGGFLEQCPVELAPGLTCIIGARGTCKSTLVESIRFAFDSDAERIAALVSEEGGVYQGSTTGLIRATLRGGSIRCTVVDVHDADATFVLEREVDGETRIFIDGVREHAQRDVLHAVEIFSQGDLQRIAEDSNDDMRLALIDRPNKARIAQLVKERVLAADQLQQLGLRVRETRAQIATFQHEIAQLTALEEQLRRQREACPELTPEFEAERVAHARRQRVLEAVREVDARRTEIAAHLSRALDPARQAAEALVRVRDGREVEVGHDVRAGLETVEATVADLRAAASAIDAVVMGPAIDALARAFEEQSEKFFRLRQEQQAANESLKQQQHLQRQVDHLRRQAKDLEKARGSEKRLLEERGRARGALARIDDEIYTLRIAEVDAINADHGGTVQLTLRSGSGAPRYVERLIQLLTGSRIRQQEEVAKALADTIAPSMLIDLVEAGNAQRLAELLDRDLGQMNRVVAHLSDHADLYALEAEPPAVRLEITFYEGGEPKRVETLSKGQRATALLPIILRPLPYPLLFDQPEDDLDNKFIFSTLIKTIRELKHKRQLIFVTHNANIPVLGGADRVVVMHMETPSRAAAPRCGSVDERKREILDLLEGGAEAFALREAHYHDLLPGVSDAIGTAGFASISSAHA